MPASPQHITLDGMGSAPPQPVAVASPASLTFPSQTVKTASPAIAVTIRNTGSGPLTITSIVISGVNAAEFTQKNTCTATTAIGADCSISVVFTPAAPGSRTAQIVITDNAGGSPQQVGLSGTGASAAPPDFTISVTPASASLNSGQSATFELSIAESNGFTQPITFACSGLPSATSCSFSPVSVTLGGSPVTMTRLNITTVARSGELFQIPKQRLVLLCMAAIWLFLPLYITTLVRTKRCIVRFAAIVVLAAGLLAGCGGVISGPVSTVTNSGTPAGTYDISVAASSENLSHQVNLSLIVK
jgi:centrosomal CEP192-like protein